MKDKIGVSLGFLSICLVLQTFSVSGKNSKLRNIYDIVSYEITLKVQPENKYIEGSNRIEIAVLKGMKKLELDLFPQLHIGSVIYKEKSLLIDRDTNSFVIHFPANLKKGDTVFFTVFYSGKPVEAKMPPWDGGFVWKHDSSGADWVGLACEGLGPSCWLPCKDEWNDEPERVQINLIVPKGLTGVSNGRFQGSKNRMDGYTEFDWLVSSPINHYDITVNIANYSHIEDIYQNEKDERLTLDYYVLPINLSEAKTHFQQVKRMLKTFEEYFGPYPFYKDGYKLVETPYWGMEHQSCVAYGNKYKNNNFGFDFIIVHESGHEWFANSITAADKADMWIHEGFTTYSEALYVEKQFGLPRALNYLAGQKGRIKNEIPIIGPRGINYNRPDNDNYYKGAWILHTMRSILDNDTLWFKTLKDLNAKFYHKIVTSKEIESFFCSYTQYDFSKFFQQYLYNKNLPAIEYYIIEKNGLNELHYHLNTDVNGLKMPVKVTTSKGVMDFLTFEKKWQIYDLPYNDPNDFKLDDKHFLIDFKKILPQ